MTFLKRLLIRSLFCFEFENSGILYVGDKVNKKMAILHMDEAQDSLSIPLGKHEAFDENDFLVQPLDTPEQRKRYNENRIDVVMDRHHAAAVIETIAVENENITKNDALADAIDRLLGNSANDMSERVKDVVEGFELPFELVLAKTILVQTAVDGLHGYWPHVPVHTVDVVAGAQFMKEFRYANGWGGLDSNAPDFLENWDERRTIYNQTLDNDYEHLSTRDFAAALGAFLSDEQQKIVIERLKKLQLALMEKSERSRDIFGASVAKAIVSSEDQPD